MDDTLKPLFGGETPVYSCETEEGLQVLRDCGLPALLLDAALDDPPPALVLFGSDLARVREAGPRVRQALAEARTRALYVPVASFDPSPRALRYTVEMFAASDLTRAAARAQTWREVLGSRPSPLVFRRPDDDMELRCHLLGDLRVSTPEQLEIQRGQWISVVRYFEVEMEVFDTEAHYFSIEGELSISGFITARSAEMKPELVHLHDEMNKLIREWADLPARLTAADNRVERIVVGGEDVTDQVLRLSGDAYDRNFVEFSIGTNSPAHDVDWSVNSLLNEGLDGIHVAIGDGVGGAHIDFVCAGARLVL